MYEFLFWRASTKVWGNLKFIYLSFISSFYFITFPMKFIGEQCFAETIRKRFYIFHLSLWSRPLVLHCHQYQWGLLSSPGLLTVALDLSWRTTGMDAIFLLVEETSKRSSSFRNRLHGRTAKKTAFLFLL